jgi:hypothetical protein
VNNIFSNVKTDRQFCATTGYTKEQFYDLVYEFYQTEQQLFREPLINFQPQKEPVKISKNHCMIKAE